MTSKERVLKTIRHEEPDRVPIGEWGIDHDHVSQIIGRHTYWRNRKDTRLALWDNRRDEVVESLKEDCAALVEKLDYDIVTVELVPSKNYHVKDKPKQIDDETWEDSKGRIYKYAKSNDSIQCMTKTEPSFEISDEEIEKVIQKYSEDIDDSCFELIDYCVERFGKDRIILCRDIVVSDPMQNPFGGDYEARLLRSVLCEDELIQLQQASINRNRKLIERCKEKGVDIMMQGEDMGMNSGCIYNPNTIRTLFFPVMEQANRDTVEAGMIPFFHCCGNIWEILDDYVRVGYQGYQSIQESAGMDNKTVKEKYGDKLTLWTGVQCETLINASIDDTEKEVRRNLELLMPGGGFIFGSTNSVQFGAKTDNYLHALELVRKYGNY